MPYPDTVHMRFDAPLGSQVQNMSKHKHSVTRRESVVLESLEHGEAREGPARQFSLSIPLDGLQKDVIVRYKSSHNKEHCIHSCLVCI